MQVDINRILSTYQTASSAVRDSVSTAQALQASLVDVLQSAHAEVQKESAQKDKLLAERDAQIADLTAKLSAMTSGQVETGNESIEKKDAPEK